MRGTAAEFPGDAQPTTGQVVDQITYDRAIWRSAMTGWWQSVVSPEPFVKRAIYWAGVWFAIGALTLILSVLEIAASYVFAGLTGAAFLIGVFGCWQRTRMNRFWDVIGGHWDKAVVTHAVFGADGIELSEDVSRRQMSWQAVDAIKGRRCVTVIRSGNSLIAVPDSTLPDALTGKVFRDQLADWRNT